jgi:transposase
MRGTFGYAAFDRNLERLAQAEYESALVLNPHREVNHPGHSFPSPTRDSIAMRFCPVLRSANLVERFFNKLKHLRTIATRYDKLARNLLAGIQLASAIILIN